MKQKISFASIGDICADIYPRNKIYLGGTAFNTAVHATKAGAHSGIFSAIGMDKSAGLFQTAFKTYGIDSSHIKILKKKTSQIEVIIDHTGQRSFSSWELGALTKYSLQIKDQKALTKYDIAKITLFKPLQDLFEQFSNMHLPSTLKVADFAGSSAYSDDIIVIQRYINQLNIVIKSLEKQNRSSLSFLQQLSFDHKGKIILALLGEKGSIVFFNGVAYEQPVIKTNVKDTNGAGDAYIAHFLVSYVAKKDLLQAMLDGSKAASEKISKMGATT